jgi:hypothetical protein
MNQFDKSRDQRTWMRVVLKRLNSYNPASNNFDRVSPPMGGSLELSPGIQR